MEIHIHASGVSLLATNNIKSNQIKKFFIPSKENVGATHKEQRQCTYLKD